jgi:hypothetical protein
MLQFVEDVQGNQRTPDRQRSTCAMISEHSPVVIVFYAGCGLKFGMNEGRQVTKKADGRDKRGSTSRPSICVVTVLTPATT